MDLNSNKVDEQAAELAGAAQAEAQPPERRHRAGSERVYLDDLSYEPQAFVDALTVMFAEQE